MILYIAVFISRWIESCFHILCSWLGSPFPLLPPFFPFFLSLLFLPCDPRAWNSIVYCYKELTTNPCGRIRGRIRAPLLASAQLSLHSVSSPFFPVFTPLFSLNRLSTNEELVGRGGRWQSVVQFGAPLMSGSRKLMGGVKDCVMDGDGTVCEIWVKILCLSCTLWLWSVLAMKLKYNLCARYV